MDVRDFGTLRAGALYRVRRSFTDYNGHLHRAGEEWTYVGHRRDDEALVFLVRGPAGEQRAIPLVLDGDHGTRAADLSGLVTRRHEVADDHRFWCGCGVGGAAWGEVLRTNGELVRACGNCQLALVVQHMAGGQRLVALDDVAREDVVQVAAIPANAPLATLLEAAICRQTYPANLVVGRLLAERIDLNWELADMLQRGRPNEILIGLEFVAALAFVPEPLDPLLVQLALSVELTADDDLIGWAHEALRRVLERFAPADVEPIAERLAAVPRGKPPSIPDDLIFDLDERLRQRLEERAAASAVLRRLVGTSKWDEAVAWLHRWAHDYPVAQRVPSRAALAEEAADALGATSQRAAQWLYEYALTLYDHAHFAVAGRDGLDQRYAVERVRRKLTHLVEHSRLEQDERHAALATLRTRVAAGELEDAALVIDDWVRTHPGGHELLTRAQLAEEGADGLAERNKPAAAWLYEWARSLFEEHAKAYAKDEGAAARSRHVRRVKQKLTGLAVYWQKE